MLEVIRPGTKVELSNDIYGTVEAVRIEAESAISYQVRWWNGRSLCTEWFSPAAIAAPQCEQPLRIGFESPSRIEVANDHRADS